MRNKLKLWAVGAMTLVFSYCQREEEEVPQLREETVNAVVDTTKLVRLEDAKSLFERAEADKQRVNATRRGAPYITLEAGWSYFRQAKTLKDDEYAKVPVIINGVDAQAEVIFVKKEGVTKGYLFVTEVRELTRDSRIVDADFYLFTLKGLFISAYRMKEGVIRYELVPRNKGKYRLTTDSQAIRTSRGFGNDFSYLSMVPSCNTENEGNDEDCGDYNGGGGKPIPLEEVTVYGTRKKKKEESYSPYPTYTPYTPKNNGFPDPEKLVRESPRGGGGGGRVSHKENGSSNLAYDMIDADGNKVEAPVIYRPTHPISDNKCFFSTVDLNKGATLTIYVDEPNPGTGDVKKGINVGHTFIGITQGENQYTYGFYPNVPGYKTLANDNVGSVLGKDNEHTFSVSISAEVTPEQLQKIIELSQKSYTRQYNLSYSNCTDFAISVANLANITLPYCKGTWTGGGGSAPGVLGKALRDSSAFKNKINTRGGKAPASKGNGC
nr:hypothetical protein [uncultured Capnocytophaga sp.]